MNCRVTHWHYTHLNKPVNVNAWQNFSEEYKCRRCSSGRDASRFPSTLWHCICHRNVLLQFKSQILPAFSWGSFWMQFSSLWNTESVYPDLQGYHWQLHQNIDWKLPQKKCFNLEVCSNMSNPEHHLGFR